jgi:hypothetical protein
MAYLMTVENVDARSKKSSNYQCSSKKDVLNGRVIGEMAVQPHDRIIK